MFRLLLLAVLAVSAGCDKDPAGLSDTGEQDPSTLRFSVNPGAGGQGTQVPVRVESTRSAFVFGATDVTFGDGITVDSLTVDDNFQATALVTIDGAADLGARDVTVTIEGRDHVLPGAFEVIAESFTVAPATGKLGETLEVTLTGQQTAWEPGYTWASFGAGVEVLSFNVVSPTQAEARISIRHDTAPGPRDVAVEDGPHVVTAYGAFIVDRAVITAFWDPPLIHQAETVAFRVTGLDTAFSSDTVITFWEGGVPNADIRVVQMTVVDASNIIGRIQASNAARLGPRDVEITTVTVDISGEPDEETLRIPDALEVLDSPPNISNVIPVTIFDVYRQIDNGTGQIAETVQALAYFVVPLDPPCGAPPPPGSGPAPYDVNGVFPTPPPPQAVDCPDPETVSAGDFVWFEGPHNVVTLHREVIASSGQIIYRGRDLTLSDYRFGSVYDLHTQGDPNGIPEVLVEEVQPTVPADYHILSPALWGDFTQARGQPFDYAWTPAQTYPDAIFVTSISGSLVATGLGGFAAAVPWDDGVHRYTPSELALLNAGQVGFQAYSRIEGRLWGLPFSTVQTAQSDSVLVTSATMFLE